MLLLQALLLIAFIFHSDGDDLSKLGILVVSRQTKSDPIQVSVDFANQGENAFDVRVAIYFNEGLTWQSVSLFHEVSQCWILS